MNSVERWQRDERRKRRAALIVGWVVMTVGAVLAGVGLWAVVGFVLAVAQP